MTNNSAFIENIPDVLLKDVNDDSMKGLLKNLFNSVPSYISIWEDGKVLYANTSFYNALGVENGNIKELNNLVEHEGYFSIHPDDFDFSPENTSSVKKEVTNGLVFNREMRIKSRLDSDFRWFNTYIVKGSDPKSKIVIEIDEDIHEKKLSAEKLKHTLAEKEELLNDKDILLKEIHHRVKNNFQVISSLLSLQSSRVNDDFTKHVLDESRSRIITMSKIHEKLYSSDCVKYVNMKENILEIVSGLLQLYSGNSKLVKFNFDIDEIKMSIDEAIPCSMIVNEVVSNSLKYAFNNFNNAQIAIKATLANKNVILKIHDNGKGYPDNFEYKTGSLGIQIVKTFARQLDGKVQFNNNEGAEFILEFPL
jgi:two-component sensor histidine kinase